MTGTIAMLFRRVRLCLYDHELDYVIMWSLVTHQNIFVLPVIIHRDDLEPVVLYFEILMVVVPYNTKMVYMMKLEST